MSSDVSALDTPALLFDLDIVESNIADMADVARKAGVALRPHVKTHKSPALARMQLDAGARGVTVAKLGEAEVMAEAGVDDMLVAYPLVGEAKRDRLRALLERATVRVSLDSVEVAGGVGRAARDAGRTIEVLLDVDSGHHRMGKPPGEPSAALAGEIARVPGVELIGLAAHAGHAYRANGEDELQAIAEQEVRDLVATADLCRRAGMTLTEISVGSTPTVRFAAALDGVTEIRPGTYVFNDVQQLRLGTATVETCGARVLTTVVGRPTDERFVIDAGTKCFSSDGADRFDGAFPGRGVVVGRPDLVIDFMTEEHGIGHRTGDQPLQIGERLEVVPLHVCAAVNLFDEAVGVRGRQVELAIPIAARGRVR